MRPFTDHITKAKNTLLIQYDKDFAVAAGISDSYAGHLLKRNWVPDAPRIAEIWKALNDTALEDGRDLKASMDDFLEAARSQLEKNPDDGVRPDLRSKQEGKRASRQPEKSSDREEVPATGGSFLAAGIENAAKSQQEFSESIRAAMKGAQKIRILAIRGLAIFGLKESLLREALAAEREPRAKVQILMLNPQSCYAAKRAAEIHEDPAAMSDGILFSLERLSELKSTMGLSLDVKLYDQLPVWRMMIADSQMFVGSFVKGIDGGKMPMISLRRQEHLTMFDAYEREFDRIWEESVNPPHFHPQKGHQGRLSFKEALHFMEMAGCDTRLIWHCNTVARIAREIAEGTKAKHPNIDVDLVHIGALLHDMGKALSSKLDHAYLGAELVRKGVHLSISPEYREKLARIIERHSAAGFSKADIERINKEHNIQIPVRDYVPETIEEICVAYADKLVLEDNVRTFAEQQRLKEDSWGGPNKAKQLKTLEKWHRMLGDPKF